MFESETVEPFLFQKLKWWDYAPPAPVATPLHLKCVHSDIERDIFGENMYFFLISRTSKETPRKTWRKM